MSFSPYHGRPMHCGKPMCSSQRHLADGQGGFYVWEQFHCTCNHTTTLYFNLDRSLICKPVPKKRRVIH